MTDSRKNHLSIDGGQPKDEDNADSYRAIPEADQEFRKSNLGKSKEKVSSDPAEEKLLKKQDEVKITPMGTEAKYDHRNGDTKIELDAAKKQFSGLTKEELLKYADDPFWVRLRWFMFVLFWALWLAMLAGAIAIIIRAPKCAPPPPKTWYEVGPLVDETSVDSVDYNALESQLSKLQEDGIKGIFINPCEHTYEVLDDNTCIDKFKEFLKFAKAKSIKLIVDLTANYVPKSHPWFQQSESNASEYRDYFTWSTGQGFDENGTIPNRTNNWVSVLDEYAWSYSPVRRQYYLHQFRSDRPDLNFHNQKVVQHFDDVIRKWVDAGADGVRLHRARHLLVDPSLPDEQPDVGSPQQPRAGAVTQYSFYKHTHTRDQPQLTQLFQHWAQLVRGDNGDKVFTIYEEPEVVSKEWHLKGNLSALHPPSARPRVLRGDFAAFVRDLQQATSNWTALQISADHLESNQEIAAVAMLLPATPLLASKQLPEYTNDTKDSEKFSHLAELRDEPSVKYGELYLAAAPALNSSATLLAAARWKKGQPGYLALFNPSEEEARANLTGVPHLPDTLTVRHVSHTAHLLTNYTANMDLKSNNVVVAGRSSLVLSYVPNSDAEA